MSGAGSSLSSMAAVLWAANMLLDTGGQLAFKAAAKADADSGSGLGRWLWMAQRPWLWIGVGCYVAEFVVWLAFLSLVPLSNGVLLGSINIVVVMVAGRLLFREALTPARLVGILFVTAGVAVVGVKA